MNTLYIYLCILGAKICNLRNNSRWPPSKRQIIFLELLYIVHDPTFCFVSEAQLAVSFGPVTSSKLKSGEEFFVRNKSLWPIAKWRP